MTNKTTKDIRVAESNANLSSGASNTPTDLQAESITNQTTTFHDDRVTDHNMFPKFVEIDQNVLKSVKEDRIHSITDFLGRPHPIGSGILTTTQVQGDQLFALNLPDDLLALPIYREKTRGFLSFRATVNLRFQANAQRFQQGRLFITYFPQAVLNPKKESIVTPSITLSTQLPRVDFDLATDSDVALSVPYVSPTLGYNQNSLTGTMGTYRVRVYSPLVSPSGPATVDWTVWAWFTDVELDFPAFTPQSNRPSGRRGQMSRIAPSEMEARMANNGPISGVLSRVNKAATLFKDVPLISSVAGNVAWVSNILSNTASAFGWSNPEAQNNVHFSKLNLAHDIANVNAVSATTNLGLLSDNKVEQLPGFGGTDVDEMSFNYLSSIPSFVNQFTFTTAQTVGSNIFSTILSPRAMSYPSPSNPNMLYPTPMCYISNLFEYWRTGFVFTLKFVKTEFHSGRVAVVFTPGTPPGLPYENTTYTYREILDLRESNEFTITIPYTSTIPYMRGPYFNSIRLVDSDSLGTLAVYVVNPLVAPTTVSTSVSCLVEVSADNTFEVAVPKTPLAFPMMYVPGTGAPSLAEQLPPDEEVFEAQALGENVQDKSKQSTAMIPAPSISGLSNDDGGVSAAAYCIGEKITSLRSLAKRAAPYYYTGTTITDNQILVRPKLVSLVNASDNTTQANVMYVDYISMIAPLYNYQRGGLRFYAYGSADTYLRVGLQTNSDSTAPVISVTVDNSTATAFAIHTAPSIAGGAAVTIPQYSPAMSEMYRLYTTGTYTLPTDVYCSDLRLYIKGNSALTRVHLLRGAADDWSCGFFTGCLPFKADASDRASTTLTSF